MQDGRHANVKHYEEWTLNILNSRRDDEAVYECQVSQGCVSRADSHATCDTVICPA